ncbi:hypothetical protein BC830DRAFT_1106287 [Chytriomyces sp. MP71]|nr:hypothetical protein BC830DRAFT_1106287 [Chytriomyces sp. MP71]
MFPSLQQRDPPAMRFSTSSAPLTNEGDSTRASTAHGYGATRTSRAPSTSSSFSLFSLPSMRSELSTPGTPWITTALTPATQRQNMRLAALLALMNRANGGTGISDDAFDGVSGGAGNEVFDVRDRTARFDKSLNEIQKLLEYAKNLDDAAIEGGDVMMMDTARRSKATSAAPVSESTHKETSSFMQKHALMYDQHGQSDGNGGIRNRFGRKPIKMIEAELKKKIDLLKSNQGEWEVFQEKILAYQKDNQTTNNIVRQNREAMAAFLPDSRQRNLESLFMDLEKHRETVLKKKKKMDKEKLKKKLEAFQKKESLLEQGKRREKEENGKSQISQKKWFIVVATAARIGYIQRTLEENRARNQKKIRGGHAARVIQKCWRQYARRKAEIRKQEALKTISTVFHYYLLRRRMEAKFYAADIIRQFFKEVHDVSKLMKVVQKYRFSVIGAQRLVRSHLEIRRAQVTAISKYWDKMEGAWWTQRKLHGGVGGSTGSVDGEKAKTSKQTKKKGKKSKDEDKDKDKGDKERGPALKVNEAIKITVITEDLLTRQQQFRKIKALYQEQLEKYLAELKKAPVKRTLFSGIKAKNEKPEDDKNAPKKPLFKLLPSVAEMFQIIEKGFLAQTNS